MREALLAYLACPRCGGDLSLEHPSPAGAEEIEAGELGCRGCGVVATIREGIPDFTGAPPDESVQRTAENFGYSWNSFHQTEEHFDEQFWAWVAPVTAGDFRGKVVLDAGCGMGRHCELAGKAGAKAVVAVDFSSAVFPARRRVRDLENVHVVRADIYALPVKRCFDIAYSVGVLHHLPDPYRGFSSVVGRVKPGGRMIAWVYGAENNGWITRIVSPLRERVLSRLPMPVLKAMAFGLTAGALYPALKGVYGPAARTPLLAPLSKRLFYSDYLTSIAPYSFNHVHGIVFDHLLAPIAYYLSREDLERWARETSLAEPVLRWHNRMSWTLVGGVPKARAGRAATRA